MRNSCSASSRESMSAMSLAVSVSRPPDPLQPRSRNPCSATCTPAESGRRRRGSCRCGGGAASRSASGPLTCRCNLALRSRSARPGDADLAYASSGPVAKQKPRQQKSPSLPSQL